MKKNKKHKFEIGEILILITCILLVTTLILQNFNVNLYLLLNTSNYPGTLANESAKLDFFETFFSVLICFIFVVIFMVVFIIIDAALYFSTVALVSLIIKTLRSFYNLFTHFLPLPYLNKIEFIRDMVKGYMPYSKLIRVLLISLSTLVLCMVIMFLFNNQSFVCDPAKFGKYTILIVLIDIIGGLYVVFTKD